jgi:hypothetical protein
VDPADFGIPTSTLSNVQDEADSDSSNNDEDDELDNEQ